MQTSEGSKRSYAQTLIQGREDAVFLALDEASSKNSNEPSDYDNKEKEFESEREEESEEEMDDSKKSKGNDSEKEVDRSYKVVDDEKCCLNIIPGKEEHKMLSTPWKNTLIV